MISERKLAANRRNALKSTGPKTAEGKRISSMNALKHGLCSPVVRLPGEAAAEFERVRNTLLHELKPCGDGEVEIFDRIVGSTWRLRRAQALEERVIDAMFCFNARQSAEAARTTFNRARLAAKLIARFARYQEELMVSLGKSLAILRQLQRLRLTCGDTKKIPDRSQFAAQVPMASQDVAIAKSNL